MVWHMHFCKVLLGPFQWRSDLDAIVIWAVANTRLPS